MGTESVYAALIGVTLGGRRLHWVGWIGLLVMPASVSTVQLLTVRAGRLRPAAAVSRSG